MANLNETLGSGATPPEARHIDQSRIEAAVREILSAIGEKPERDGLQDTPGRVARMYAEMFGGLHVDPGRHLHKVFEDSGCGLGTLALAGIMV
ncbi:MAG: hypothetical protein GY826_02010, partial [Fuerstiella sp.]|nr:hypothetical protein [Fuerstiella sp.]